MLAIVMVENITLTVVKLIVLIAKQIANHFSPANCKPHWKLGDGRRQAEMQPPVENGTGKAGMLNDIFQAWI